MGTNSTIAVPNTATSSASAARAQATPIRADRHCLVTPTARTIVTASTNSTDDARKLETIVTRASEDMAAC